MSIKSENFYLLAEIERMQLEIEYDRLKHQLSPRHKKNPTSPRIIKKKENTKLNYFFLS